LYTVLFEVGKNRGKLAMNNLWKTACYPPLSWPVTSAVHK